MTDILLPKSQPKSSDLNTCKYFSVIPTPDALCTMTGRINVSAVYMIATRRRKVVLRYYVRPTDYICQRSDQYHLRLTSYLNMSLR